MKRILLISTVIFLASCGGKPTDKKSELDALKKERATLNSKIEKLESELGTVTANEDVKDISVLELGDNWLILFTIRLAKILQRVLPSNKL